MDVILMSEDMLVVHEEFSELRSLGASRERAMQVVEHDHPSVNPRFFAGS